MKKAQTEIIGLVVIVILLTLLAVIFIKFALKEQPSTSAILRTSTKADNLLNSIIRTSTPNGKLLDLVVDSHIKGDFTYLNQEITKVLTKTLSHKQYSFKIFIDQQPVLEIGTCKTGIASNKPYKYEDYSLKFSLVIC